MENVDWRHLTTGSSGLTGQARSQLNRMLCGRLTKPQNLQEEIFPSLLLLFVKHQPFRKKVDSNATNLIHIHRNDEKHA